MNEPKEPVEGFSVDDPRLALHRLTAFAQSMLQQNTLEDLLWDIAGKVGELLGFEDCVVYLIEEDFLVQYAAYGVKHQGARQIRNRIAIPMAHGIVGAVATSRRPERIDDTAADPRYIVDEFSGRSELAVPIVFADRTLGVLDSESSRPGAYSATDQAMFTSIATLAAPRIASALAERDHTAAVAALHDAEAAHRSRERRLHEERSESLAQLAGGIAHDFNNLLSVILGNISLAQASELPAATGLLLDDAVDACLRAKTLTQQLLAFVRGGEPTLTSDDLIGVITSSVQFARRGTDLQVELDLADDLHRVRFNGGQLTQVFHNLVTNAAQARGDASVRISARNATVGEMDFVEVRVHDDGPGVPEHLRLRIFDPYFTTKERGSGLGLATSYWIIRGHGGTLELDVSAEPGACIVVRLPRACLASATDAEGRSASDLRLLVMADDNAYRRELVRLLQELGHCVETALHSDECVQRYVAAASEQAPFRAVFLDRAMRRGAGGEETAEILRAVDTDLRAILVVPAGEPVPTLSAAFCAQVDQPVTKRALQAALRAATSCGRGAPGR